ncbi:MAG: c-type cytochrome [Planctomycetales bacterium]|nr:c-type cytochrome [Planctomycetales bacterium]
MNAQHSRLVGFLTVTFLGLAAAAPAYAADATADLRVPPGYQIEKVYAPPLAAQGSWVAMTVDERGRLIASDQDGALYRLTPGPLGAPASRTKVEKIPLEIGMAQGLACLDGQLYVMVNGLRGAISSGLYRLSDSTGDDQYDRVEQLRVWQGAGEHGPHAVKPGPNGKSLYVLCGNATRLPMMDGTLVPNFWREDRLLPALFANQFEAGNFETTGAWVARIDLESEELTLHATGMRNPYDFAFNADGELFTFDADNEDDMGMPWYRPTRVCHLPSGVDMGWRATDGKWPDYYIDSLPPAVDVGPGSPTGLAFGNQTKFPAPYNEALFAGDWALGKIYAIHLRPEGGGYGGTFEQFASGAPLAVTALAVRPQDGALYVLVGGRKSESAVYRIYWKGGAPHGEATAPPLPTSEQAATAAAARSVRHELETFHAGTHPDAVPKLWPHLASRDPAVRSAARIALEHQPLQSWGEQALNEPDPRRRIAALAALARVSNPAVADVWTESLSQVAWESLTAEDQLDYVRAAQLGVLRLEPSPAARQKLLAKLDPHFPANRRELNQELGPLLTRLEAPGILPRLLEVLAAATTFGEGVDPARSLSTISTGWTLPQRRQMLAWFDKAAGQATAGNFKSLTEIRDRFIETFTKSEQTALERELALPFVQKTAAVAVEQRPFVREWTLDQAIDAVEQAPGERDRENGKRLFAAAQCSQCHAVAGAGAAVGPDLTGVGGRFSVKDILKSIVTPNDTISDQYQQTLFIVNGMAIVGRVSNLNEGNLLVSTDMLDSSRYVSFHRDDIEEQRPSEVSVMPSGLLNTLTAEEIADLVYYLRHP